MHFVSAITVENATKMVLEDVPWNQKPRPPVGSIKLYARAQRGKVGWPWIYFHGIDETIRASFKKHNDMNLQDAPDLISGDVSYIEIPDGIHRVQVYDDICWLFLWTVLDFGGTRARRHGLVTACRVNDQAMYALRKYRERSPCL